MQRSREDLAQAVVDYLVEMQSGRCAIEHSDIEREYDADRAYSEVLAGLLFLHEDLKLRERARAVAEDALRERNAELERSQAALEELAAELSTPVIRVWTGILMLPIVGTVDRERASEITDRLLSTVNAERATHVILDLTGVATVDDSTADQLVQIVGSVQLLGARTIVAGIQPQVSTALVGLGANLERLHTTRSTEDALRIALATAAR